MLMYRGRKDTYWFQPAIVRIAYRMSSLELSYFGHVFLCGCVRQCVWVCAGEGRSVDCYNKWVARAGVAFFLPLLLLLLFFFFFFMVVTSAAPRRDNPIAPGLAGNAPPLPPLRLRQGHHPHGARPAGTLFCHFFN